MIFLIFIVLIFIFGNLFVISRTRKRIKENIIALTAQAQDLSIKHKEISVSVADIEAKISRQFALYDLIRKIDPILNRQKLISTFVEEIRRCGGVQDVCLANFRKDGYSTFTIRGDENEVLLVKPKAQDVLEYMPILADLLALCLERISLYERLQKLSIYDTLTSVYNRRYFMARYDEELGRAKKHKHNLSLLILDLDYFKKVNDQFGHLVGDAVLSRVAAIIKDSVREVDFAARLGGEEFAVVLSETDIDGAVMVAQRIRTKVAAERISAFDETVAVTISIGVASYPNSQLSAPELFELADKHLYQAKNSGRNRVISA
jgi:diguanylate cyclase (GGDEF)-like protein